MLRKFCETVNIVLDTSQIFGIISHTEQAVLLKGAIRGDAVFYFNRHREALSHPQNALPDSSESTYVAILSSLPPPVFTRTYRKVCPANLN
jgi:hypothetical protein